MRTEIYVKKVSFFCNEIFPVSKGALEVNIGNVKTIRQIIKKKCA